MSFRSRLSVYRKELIIGLLIGVSLAMIIIFLGPKALTAYYRSPQGRYDSLQSLAAIICKDHVYAEKSDDPLGNAYLEYFNETDLPDKNTVKRMLKEKIKQDDDAYYTLANLMLSHYDRYSSLSKPEIYERMYPDNEDYTGLGAEISGYGPFIRINNIYEDSAAGRAGFMVNDLICSIGEHDIRSLTYEESRQILSEEISEGTTLGIYRQDEDAILYFEITAEEVIVPNVSWKIEDDTAYLDITLFRGNTFEKDIDEALLQFAEAGIGDLILDLRDNRGGYISYLEFVLNRLTPDDDSLLFTEHYRRKDTEFLSSGSNFSFDNIIVLVNQNTCSSAEVVSGSLKDQGHCLIGQTTYGKAVGLSNRTFRGDRLVLATMTLELPETGDYNDKGIEPSVSVENGLAKMPLPEYSDIALNGHIGQSSVKEDILALEERLSLLGYQFEGIDGIWDDATDDALSAFYSGNGERYDYVCSMDMYSALDSLCTQFYDAVYIEDTQLIYALDLLAGEAA